MSVADLALQRDKYKHLTDEEWRWFLQQVEGRERTADKLPTFAAIPDWWYPVRLSCEQCSSELAARYKREILQAEPVLQCNGLTAQRSYSPKDGLSTMVDLTGGYGVDTYFLSEGFAHTDYVEQNEELCRIASHNFALIDNRKSIIVTNTTAEEFLSSLSGEVGRGYDLIFLDPARRDSHGGKVFRLEDCTPNVVELLPALVRHLTANGRILLKLSPMLDLTQAIKSLSTFNFQPSTLHWSIHVVAIKNEVKELLLLSHPLTPNPLTPNPSITAIDLAQKDQAFVFTKEEESAALPDYSDYSDYSDKYLYEPNAAILKAGAYKLIAERFGLTKLDVNTHLYVSDSLVPNFPGRVWQIKFEIKNQKFEITHANVLCRNYPLTPEQLKKKLHLRDGGTAFVIGCRVAGKPTLFLAERVEDIH